MNNLDRTRIVGLMIFIILVGMFLLLALGRELPQFLINAFVASLTFLLGLNIDKERVEDIIE